MSEAAALQAGFAEGGRVRAIAGAVPRPSALERLLLTLAVLILFLFSNFTLNAIGIDYGTNAGGSLIWRFHPASYLVFATVALAAMRRGNPVRFLDLVLAWPVVALALVLFLFVVFWAAAIIHVPFTPPLETFIVPCLFFFLLSEHGEAMKRRLALVAHVCMTANAILGLVEYAVRFNFIPSLQETPFRATALLGHPLENAMITGLYVIACACGGLRDVNRHLRAPMLMLQIVALLAFGGRTGMVVTYALLPLTALPHVLRGINRRGIGRREIVIAILALFVLAGLFAFLDNAGLFATQLYRFQHDYGSAHTREVLPALTGHFSLSDLFFGPDQVRLGDYQFLEGTPLGIESFWYGSLLLYGIIGVVPLWIGCGFLSWAICRLSRPGAILVTIQFWIVASGSNSISQKGLELFFVEIMVLCLLRPLSATQQTREPAAGPARK